MELRHAKRRAAAYALPLGFGALLVACGGDDQSAAQPSASVDAPTSGDSQAQEVAGSGPATTRPTSTTPAANSGNAAPLTRSPTDTQTAPLSAGAAAGSGATPNSGAAGNMMAGAAAGAAGAAGAITTENDRPCSPFYKKLDVTKIATGGQSCGGMMTMLSAGDERVNTAMVFNSGTSGNNSSLFASYHAPMLFLAGGSSDFLSSSATANVEAIDNVPIFYGNLQVGHGGTWESTNGGEMGRVALGWLKWKLQGDNALEAMFVGADCELCKPASEWTVVKKMID